MGIVAGQIVCSRVRSVTLGNTREEEETVMSRFERVSCPTFLSIPPAHTHTCMGGGGVGGDGASGG